MRTTIFLPYVREVCQLNFWNVFITIEKYVILKRPAAFPVDSDSVLKVGRVVYEMIVYFLS